MRRTHAGGLVLLSAVLLLPGRCFAADPLHKQIDELIAAKAKGRPASAPADDAELLRRVYLDFAGRIPSVAEARDFLEDKSADKRTKLIDRLLSGPEYPRRMAEAFHVLLIERLGDRPDWAEYLRTSFEKNKPWDQMAREVLHASSRDESAKGASFFMAKRLENYGQNPVDYPGLTRDIGRLFLGMDLQCAQCHDHLFIGEYSQRDFQGLFAFVENAYLDRSSKPPVVAEKLTTKKVAFMSVFRKVRMETGPRVPGRKEISIPEFKKGEEYRKPPDRKKRTPGVPKFSPLEKLAEQLPVPENTAFNRNIVNRLWCLLLGRGIVHPLDLHHSGNPPSHPELLDLLAKEFVAHKYDIKWLLRELALTQTYQRSSILPASGGHQPPVDTPPELFLTAHEKRLSAEQLLWSILEATGEKERVQKSGLDAARKKFVKAFANQPRQPEDEFNPSLKAALFVLNDSTVTGWLKPRSGNLVDRASKLPDDKATEELYLSILTRLPTEEEKAEVAAYLQKNAARRPVAVGHLAWALLASTEFCVNH